MHTTYACCMCSNRRKTISTIFSPRRRCRVVVVVVVIAIAIAVIVDVAACICVNIRATIKSSCVIRIDGFSFYYCSVSNRKCNALFLCQCSSRFFF